MANAVLFHSKNMLLLEKKESVGCPNLETVHQMSNLLHLYLNNLKNWLLDHET